MPASMDKQGSGKHGSGENRRGRKGQKVLRRNIWVGARLAEYWVVLTIMCGLVVSANASELKRVATETTSSRVVITAENIQLLNAVRETAIESGYRVETGSGSGGEYAMNLFEVGTEEALIQLLKRMNHILAYTAGEPRRIGRVVLLGIDDGDASLLEQQAAIVPVMEAPGHGKGLTNPKAPSPVLDDTEHWFDVQSLGPENAILKLEGMLGAKRRDEREWAIHRLGEFGVSGHQRAVLALGQVIFSEPLPARRVDAVNWLRSIGSEASVLFVQAARSDTSEKVRKVAEGI